MKKFLLVDAKTLDEVEKFAAGLENAERMVDRILQAARLDRSPRAPMHHDSLCAVLVAIGVYGAILMVGASIICNIIF